jgi:apolipoprotein N-acyltransferase
MLCCEGAGVLTEARLPATDSKLRVLFVQPNVGNYDKYLAERGPQYQVPVVEKMLASTKPMLELARWPNPTLDLIVWPETAYPVALDPGLNYPLAKRLFDFIAAFKVPLITGAYSNEKETNPLDGAANGVFGIDASGQVTAAYRKHILLAFGEYIPGAEIFPWLKTLVPEIGDFKRGRGAQVFTLGAQKYFPMICYEALAPDYVAKAAKLGAHFLVNPTNDSWYGLISEPQQHMIMAAGRALELRLPLLRPTNTGLSVAVDAHGQIQTVGPQKVEMAQVLEVPYSSHPRPTVFSKLVPWMTSLLLGLSILVILLGRLFRVRTQI